MRNLKFLTTLAAVMLVVAACSTPRYIISTNDGTLIQSKGESRLNAKTGMYEYHDLDGRDAAIKQSEVKQVVRR